MDDARTLLFPLYASLLTPVWLRALGAKVGRDVEASTVLLLPRMTTVGDGAFLADDTLVGSYELGGGWLRIERAKVGKRAFLGNSGMTAPGRAVPKRGLVAVLSATPANGQGGTAPGWAARRCSCAAPPGGATRRAPSDPPAAAAGGPRRGRGLPARAGDLHRRARRRRAAGTRRRASSGGACWVAVAARRAGGAARRAGRVRR